MQNATLQNLSRPASSPLTIGYCASFLCRLRGLTFRRHLNTDWGLLLVQSRDSRIDSSIHMLFVFFDLAVIWINSAGEVVDVIRAYRWRPAYLPQHPARYVLELAVEHLNDFKVGDKVRIEPT